MAMTSQARNSSKSCMASLTENDPGRTPGSAAQPCSDATPPKPRVRAAGEWSQPGYAR
jgi:hypothetical protein